jgi:hypothetical protein
MLPLVILSCGELKPGSKELGSSYNKQGIITNKSLAYNFDQYRDGGRYKDLFNYIYFEGDTVCFSFSFTRPLKGFYPEIVFVNPANGTRYPAERIDIHDDTASGFSLAGTLLEQFMHEKLFQKLPSGSGVIELPFEVHLQLNTGKTIILEKLHGTCIIRYGKR